MDELKRDACTCFAVFSHKSRVTVTSVIVDFILTDAIPIANPPFTIVYVYISQNKNILKLILADRQSDRQTERQTNRQTDRQTERQTDRDREREIERDCSRRTVGQSEK